jgi:hypothetical protein
MEQLPVTEVIVPRYIGPGGRKEIQWDYRLTSASEREQADYFQFPARNKKGCQLDMDLKFDGTKLGQSQVTETKDGCVKSRLNNKITSLEKH